LTISGFALLAVGAGILLAAIGRMSLLSHFPFEFLTNDRFGIDYGIVGNPATLADAAERQGRGF
jgi:hypothetical protein